MIRRVIIGFVRLFFAAGALLAQGAAPGPSPKPAAPSAASRIPARVPAGNAGPPARLFNPGIPAARLMLATPEQRERALEKLPPEQQDRIRKQLAWFDSLPMPQQELQIRRLQRFAGLPPEKQMAVRNEMRLLNQLPPPRKAMVRRAWQLLENLPKPQRDARMNSKGFKNRFSTDEQKLLSDLCEAWLPPI